MQQSKVLLTVEEAIVCNGMTKEEILSFKTVQRYYKECKYSGISPNYGDFVSFMSETDTVISREEFLHFILGCDALDDM